MLSYNQYKDKPLLETRCVTPPNVVGGVVSLGNLTVGSEVTYEPSYGQRHVGGDLVRICGEDELWGGEQPVFERM